MKNASTNKSVVYEMTKTNYMTGTETDIQGAQAIDMTWTALRDVTDGTLKATLTNNVISY